MPDDADAPGQFRSEMAGEEDQLTGAPHTGIGGSGRGWAGSLRKGAISGWRRGRRGEPDDPVLGPLIEIVRTAHPKADVRLIVRAYAVAAQTHNGQSLRGGDPYVTHPLAVATILAELGMNYDVICAALLHDSRADTPYTLGWLREEFGTDVAELVDGVTRLDKVKYGDAARAETVRRMVVAMSRDIRALVIKLADRLHDMRTVGYLPRDEQEQRSREALEVFAPLARRLGMTSVDWELEDLAFATLFPERYEEIGRLVRGRVPDREQVLQRVVEDLTGDLRGAKVKADVVGRLRHYYSVHQEMTSRDIGLEEIDDLVAVDVRVNSLRDCYVVLEIAHGRWTPVPGRFRDHIAAPGPGTRQSLRTTVTDAGGKPVELQIRTWAMYRRAEYGVAAHLEYQEEMTGGGTDTSWLRQLVDWQPETEDPAEFLDSLRFDLRGAEIYVFTPKGEVIALPQGATPVDFAYAIHTEVGHRTIGARVNGRLVPLDGTLNSGDTVEILTSAAPDAGPTQDWLGFVKSARARNKIRHWLSKERPGAGR